MTRGRHARRDEDEALARRADLSVRALNRLRWRLRRRQEEPEGETVTETETEELAALVRRVTTTRRTETVYPRDEEDFEPYDQLVIVAHLTINGIEYMRAATLAPNAYPEVVDRVEALTVEQLARTVIEEIHP